MKEIIAEPGTPIYDFSGTTIWAFFKERMVSYGTIEFHNVPQLLGIPTIEETKYNSSLKSSAKLHVYFNTFYQKWIAGSSVVQKDFEECEYFYMNRMHGPQNSYEALDLLLQDKEFIQFIKSASMFGNENIDRLKYYHELLDNKRRR